MAPIRDDPPELSRIGSPAIRWVVDRAIAEGNALVSLADWSKALVAHMRGGLTPKLKAEVAARWPELAYFSEPGTPHNEPHEGYIDDGFAVSFPRPCPAPSIED